MVMLDEGDPRRHLQMGGDVAIDLADRAFGGALMRVRIGLRTGAKWADT